MSDHHYQQTMLIGVAVAAGILGTLTSLLGTRKTIKKGIDQGRELAGQALESGEIINKKMMLGGVAGGIVGATAALLFAPKAGSELIKDMTRPFTSHTHTHPVAHPSTSRKKEGARASKSRSARKAPSQHPEKKTRIASAAKKSSTRHRTAKPPVQPAQEKETGEAKEA